MHSVDTLDRGDSCPSGMEWRHGPYHIIQNHAKVTTHEPFASGIFLLIVLDHSWPQVRGNCTSISIHLFWLLLQQHPSWSPCLWSDSAPCHLPNAAGEVSQCKPVSFSCFKPFILKLQDKAQIPWLGAQRLLWAFLSWSSPTSTNDWEVI